PERVVPQALRGTWSASGATHRLVVERDGARLFDCAADPGEEHDLAREKPELVRSLTEAHRAFAKSVAPVHLEPVRPAKTASDGRDLDALGYGGEGAEAAEDGDGAH